MTKRGLQGIEIAGYGKALPKRVVTNEDAIAHFEIEGKTPADIVRVTGIESRHWSEGLWDDNARLATAAGTRALEMAGIDPSQVESLIVATTTTDQRVPAVSADISARLGLNDAAAFDINAACSGFTYALNDAMRRIHCGERTSLVIGCDILTRLIDHSPEAWRTGVLFGDGAGAAVLRRNDERPEAGLLGWAETANGTLREILQAEQGKPLEMAGSTVFRHAIKLMPAVGQRALDMAGLTPDQITKVIPHQANRRILEASAKEMGIDMDKMVWTGDHHSNTSSASIPMALAETIEAGEIQRDDAILLVGFGAGMTAAASVIRY